MAKRKAVGGKKKKLTRLQKKRQEVRNNSIPILKYKLLYAKILRERQKYRKLIKRKENDVKKFRKENLKKFGTTTPYSEKHITHTNKILRKERLKREKEKERVEKASNEQQLYRYSISYYNGNYDKTFRAEVIVIGKRDNDLMFSKLDSFLISSISRRNKGLQIMFKKSQYIGLESELIGHNDAKGDLNRFHFSLD